MPNRQPLASLSLDLDNKWSYLKTHGDATWATLPSYFELLIPRVLDFLAQRQQTITFFVVGQDAALPQHVELLREVAQHGHEIGNHSFHHEPWLHLYSEAAIDHELARTEEALERVTGVRPVGFRGPGYSCSESTLRVLYRRGYQYDASTLPTFLGPLARLYYFMTARLSPAEKQERSKLFGTVRDGLRPLHAYRWTVPETGGKQGLVEIPVTTMPLLKIPIHMSYLLYLSHFSPIAAVAYFRTALALCRLQGIQPSLLLHPLDFMGVEDDRDLAFFPGMGLPKAHKLALVSDLLGIYCQQFQVVTMAQHASHVATQPGVPTVDARVSFAHVTA